MALQLEQTEAEAELATRFAAAEPTLIGGKQQRAASFAAFLGRGLPHRRVEEWRYTDLRALMQQAWPLAGAPDDAHLAAAKAVLPHVLFDGARALVLVDGAFHAALSDLAALEPGLTIRSLAGVLGAEDVAASRDLASFDDGRDAMLALNGAFMGDGAMIAVADGVALARPLHVIHVTTSAERSSRYTRSRLALGNGARASLIETFVAAEQAAQVQINDAMLMTLGEGARLDHVRMTADPQAALNVSTLVVRLGAGATLATCNVAIDGDVSRYQSFIHLDGENASVETNAITLVSSRQHADTALFLDHAVPHCTSRALARSALDGEGRGIFQGRILVRPDAQKTDAKMMARALLLSDRAEAIAKPELEIFADDVVCGHGATCGALEEAQLFYLMARGIPRQEAEAVLIEAFIDEALDGVADEVLRARLAARVGQWMRERDVRVIAKESR